MDKVRFSVDGEGYIDDYIDRLKWLYVIGVYWIKKKWIAYEINNIYIS